MKTQQALNIYTVTKAEQRERLGNLLSFLVRYPQMVGATECEKFEFIISLYQLLQSFSVDSELTKDDESFVTNLLNEIRAYTSE